jgi:hypothetical protein
MFVSKKCARGGIEGYIEAAREYEATLSEPRQIRKVRATRDLAVALDAIIADLPDDEDVPRFAASALSGALVTVFSHYLDDGMIKDAIVHFLSVAVERALPMAADLDRETRGVGEPIQ